MRTRDEIWQRLDEISAELNELRREIILQSDDQSTTDDEEWEDILDLTREISASWTGPGAVEEIRSQREK